MISENRCDKCTYPSIACDIETVEIALVTMLKEKEKETYDSLTGEKAMGVSMGKLLMHRSRDH